MYQLLYFFNESYISSFNLHKAYIFIIAKKAIKISTKDQSQESSMRNQITDLMKLQL